LAADRSGLERSDRTRSTPLHVAARYGALETARYLIDQGAKVNIRDESGNTPLHPASLFGHASIVEALAAAGADINALNDEGSSPLALAVVYGPAPVVDWLLSHKANPALKDRNGDTPLHLAAAYGNREKALAIMKRVTDIDIKNGNGKTPLQAMLGNTYYGEIARDLLDWGASLTATDGEGKNALHLASEFFVREPYLKLFLEKGGAANSRDRAGNAPLHLILMEALKLKSVYPSLKEKITSLIEYGADPALKNTAGKSPMDLAREIGDKAVLDLVTGR
jgi:ankyrin repeat protein